MDWMKIYHDMRIELGVDKIAGYLAEWGRFYIEIEEEFRELEDWEKDEEPLPSRVHVRIHSPERIRFKQPEEGEFPQVAIMDPGDPPPKEWITIFPTWTDFEDKRKTVIEIKLNII